jgi:RNA polymerase sigma factor (sigma-70 family)
LLSDVTIEQQRALVDRIRSGDSSAETELVHQFGRRLFVMAWARTRDREAARELTQDIMVAVIRSLRDGKLENAEKLPAFVHGTARNLINNYLRLRRQRPIEEPLTLELTHCGFEVEVENAERLRLVHRALEQMGTEDRRILLMTLVDGLKPGEIAAELGLTSEVVRTRKLRAIKKITDFVRNMSRI